MMNSKLKLTVDMKDYLTTKFTEVRKYTYCARVVDYFLSDRLSSLFGKDKKTKHLVLGFELDEDNENIPSILPKSFLYDNPKKGFCVVSNEYYDDNGTHRTVFVFFNDEKKILKLFDEESSFELKNEAYELLETGMGPIFSKINLKENVDPILKEGQFDDIVEDVTNFFKKESFYAENNFTYKRGLLMYGLPGTGKTSCIKSLAKKFPVPTVIIGKDIKLTSKVKDLLEQSCRKGSIIVFEDIDGVHDYNRSEFLNFLDGVQSPHGAYFIATTNYLERVDFALKNRPSRFDRVLEVGLPEKEEREKLFKLYFKDDIKGIDITKAVKETEGFSGAFFKELYILFKMNGITLDEAIKRIKKHLEIAKSNYSPEDEYMG